MGLRFTVGCKIRKPLAIWSLFMILLKAHLVLAFRPGVIWCNVFWLPFGRHVSLFKWNHSRPNAFALSIWGCPSLRWGNPSKKPFCLHLAQSQAQTAICWQNGKMRPAIAYLAVLFKKICKFFQQWPFSAPHLKHGNQIGTTTPLPTVYTTICIHHLTKNTFNKF